jgi:hypothetical protein
MLSLETILVFLSSAFYSGTYSLASIPHILGGIADFFGLVILLVIGVLIIVLVVGLAIFLFPAGIVAVIVFFLTGSYFYAGIAFLIIALISLVTLASRK